MFEMKLPRFQGVSVCVCVCVCVCSGPAGVWRLPADRIQRGEPFILAGLRALQENDQRGRNGGSFQEDLHGVCAGGCSETGTALEPEDMKEVRPVSFEISSDHRAARFHSLPLRATSLFMSHLCFLCSRGFFLSLFPHAALSHNVKTVSRQKRLMGEIKSCCFSEHR